MICVKELVCISKKMFAEVHKLKKKFAVENFSSPRPLPGKYRSVPKFYFGNCFNLQVDRQLILRVSVTDPEKANYYLPLRTFVWISGMIYDQFTSSAPIPWGTSFSASFGPAYKSSRTFRRIKLAFFLAPVSGRTSRRRNFVL